MGECMNTISDIRVEFQRLLLAEEFVIDRTGCKILEILGAQFYADEDHIFGTPNQNYIERELEWYRSQSLNVNDIAGKTPAIWISTGDDNGNINSNYGWCIWSDENHNQYENVLKDLKDNMYSRRAQMIYTRPEMQEDYKENGKNDFMCTNVTNHFIRNNELVYMVYMRSNDSIFGFMNDLAWHEYVYNRLLIDLREIYPSLVRQHILWSASSLQVYERHFQLIGE